MPQFLQPPNQISQSEWEDVMCILIYRVPLRLASLCLMLLTLFILV